MGELVLVHPQSQVPVRGEAEGGEARGRLAQTRGATVVESCSCNYVFYIGTHTDTDVYILTLSMPGVAAVAQEEAGRRRGRRRQERGHVCVHVCVYVYMYVRMYVRT